MSTDVQPKTKADQQSLDVNARRKSFGYFQPLRDTDVLRIHEAALKVLENIGMGEPIPLIRELALKAGCRMNDQDRLCFPPALVEDLLAKARRDTIRYGRDPQFDVDTSAGAVNVGPGGVASHVLDFETGKYRLSTLLDYYDFARLTDCLDNLQMTSCWMAATDIADPVEADINRAYTLAATSKKPMLIDLNVTASVEPMVGVFDAVLGEEGGFVKRPFAVFGGCPVRSPLCYGAEQSEALVTAAMTGVPVSLAMAAQVGATAPTALAGGLVQAMAETLAAYVQIKLAAPDQFVELGMYPFMTDLRSGQFTGGSGEQALLSAAVAQICQFYGLPFTVGAGMTDAKVPDFQAGYEKAIGAALTGVAGSPILGMAAGMTASIVGASAEMLVIDNDLFGSLNSALRPIEVNDETLSYEVIKETVAGQGHYLSHPQTLGLMRSAYYYPKVADRSTLEGWVEKGSPDIRAHARMRTRKLLSTHYPTYIEPAVDAKIRERFPIHLPREMMCAETGRW